MQTAHSTLSSTKGVLRKMVGVQYVLHDWPGSLLVIKKCRRQSSEKAQVLDFYYIMSGTIYQAPVEKEVSRTRYTNIMFSMMLDMAMPNREPRKEVVIPAHVYTNGKQRIPSSRLQGLLNLYHTDYKESKNWHSEGYTDPLD